MQLQSCSHAKQAPSWRQQPAVPALLTCQAVHSGGMKCTEKSHLHGEEVQKCVQRAQRRR